MRPIKSNVSRVVAPNGFQHGNAFKAIRRVPCGCKKGMENKFPGMERKKPCSCNGKRELNRPMQIVGFSAIPANEQIVLPTGRVISVSSVSHDPKSNHFFYGIFDCTKQMTRAQMRRFPTFDEERANLELYIDKYRREHGGQNPPGEQLTPTQANKQYWATIAREFTNETAKDLNPLDKDGALNTILNFALFAGLIYVGVSAIKA